MFGIHKQNPKMLYSLAWLQTTFKVIPVSKGRREQPYLMRFKFSLKYGSDCMGEAVKRNYLFISNRERRKECKRHLTVSQPHSARIDLLILYKKKKKTSGLSLDITNLA